MRRRLAFQVLLASASALLLALPATTGHAAPNSKFRSVLIGSTGKVLVKNLPSRGKSAAHRHHPFLGLAGVPGNHQVSPGSSAAPVLTTTTGTNEEVLTSFQAVTLDSQLALGADQFVTPPDNGLAAGPNHVVEMVNDSGTIWDKTGSLIQLFDLNTFFDVPADYTFSDPRILYDHMTQRWFASGVAFIAPSYGSVIVINVSTGSDPTGTWVRYRANDNPQQTHDQPKFGVSSDKFVISWNDFLNAQFFQGQTTWVLEKSQMVAGSNPVNGAALGPDSSRAAIVPAVQLSPGSNAYMVYNNSDCFTLGCNRFSPTLGVVWITGTPLQGNVGWNEADPGMPATSQPPNADQPGMPGSIATNDDRLLTAVWQNGVLWTGGNDACLPPNDNTTRPCSRLIQVSTAGPTITQDFDIASPGGGLYYPALAMDGGGNMYVVYNISSSSQYVGVRITGELASSPPQTLAAAQTIRAGDTTYDMNRCFQTAGGASRWGDYSGAAIDPQNPTDVWVAAEYAAIGTATTPASDAGCAWGTFAARLTFSGPAVSGISPSSEQSGGPTTITVTGTDFAAGSTVSFGPNNATNVSVTSPNQLSATAPSGCGTVDVTVTTPNGTSATSTADRFTYLLACGGGATLLSIFPTSGPAAGGTVVTVEGTGFVSGSTVVYFGGVPATNVSCASSQQCDATTPAGAGSVGVTATVNGQFASGSATYTYVALLTSIDPTSGPEAGGTVVTLNGMGFDPGTTAVNFGANPATNVTCASTTQCQATAPAGTGSVTVTMRSAGMQADGSATYSYVAGPPPPPTLTSISPTSGPESGGTVVTVNGSGFVSGTTVVNFGANPATNVTCGSSSQCQATAPQGTGSVTVTATVGGVPATGSATYTYIPPPSLTSISPTSGPATGGTVVAVNGTGFISGSTTVRFGSNLATDVSCASSTQCQATSPAGVGVVLVTVVVGAQQATGSVTYTYISSLTSISPSTGSASGGTRVTITGTGFVPGSTEFFFGSSAATSVSCSSSTQCTATTPAGQKNSTVAVAVNVGGVSGSNSLTYRYRGK